MDWLTRRRPTTMFESSGERGAEIIALVTRGMVEGIFCRRCMEGFMFGKGVDGGGRRERGEDGSRPMHLRLCIVSLLSSSLIVKPAHSLQDLPVRKAD